VSENRVDTEVDQLRQKYGLTVVLKASPFIVDCHDGRIHGKEADSKNFDSYWPLFWSEWNLYPSELVKQTRLERIYLCEGLEFENTALGWPPQERTALPDFEHHDLYLDISRGHENILYVRKVIHHEFFHIIDFCMNGLAEHDPEWEGLNDPSTFKYGGGGELFQNHQSTSVLSEDRRGFLNEYSTSKVIEDKAEIFANMVAEDRNVIQQRSDIGIIKQKIQKMEERLKNFCPQLDKQFWEMAGTVDRRARVA
jgi:hypothetical protein